MNKFEGFNPGSEYKELPKSEKEFRSSHPESVENQNNIQEKTPGGIEKIEEIHRQIQASATIQPPKQEIPVTENPTETEVINGQQYTVEYVPKEDIYPAYGYGGGNSAVVRQDLPPRVKNFVKAHELYHCQDKSNFGGWLGREIRANVIPGLKDPIGLAATVWKTITDVDRIKLYLKRIKEGY